MAPPASLRQAPLLLHISTAPWKPPPVPLKSDQSSVVSISTAVPSQEFEAMARLGYEFKAHELIAEQTEGLLHAADFSGGGAENPYCSFHAGYRVRPDGTLRCLPRRSGGDCCCTASDDSRTAVADQWSGVDQSFEADGELEETSALDAFLTEARRSSFTVSGMVFQDAWNLDLDRLRRCHICEVDSERGMVPFCAYNLTDSAGRALYRR